MPVSLQKGQKVSLTKDNPGLKKVVVGLGWDVNAFDTGGDFDLDAAAFLLNDTGRVGSSSDFLTRREVSYTREITSQVSGTGMTSRSGSICQRFLTISRRLPSQ